MPIAILIGPSAGGRSSVGEQISNALDVRLVEMEHVVHDITGMEYELLTLQKAPAEIAGHLREAQERLWASESVVTLVPLALEDEAIADTVGRAVAGGVPLIALTADMTTLARRNGLNAPRSLALGQPRKWFADMVRVQREKYLSLGAKEYDTGNAPAKQIAEKVLADFALQ